MGEFISGLSVLGHWPKCLFLYWYCAFYVPVALLYVWTSAAVIPIALFILFKMALFCFLLFKFMLVGFPGSVKNALLYFEYCIELIT